MQLTQHTDFGLRLLIVLARREGEAVSVPAFAAEQGLSPHHVAKVAQALVHEGFARSLRGAAAASRWRARRTDQRGRGGARAGTGMKLADCAAARCAPIAR
jgi:Rrf2 family nitric oxide-sensitive transcriptional repressor